MVSTLIKDCNILSNYTTLCDMSIEKVCKEVSLNLLEDLIMLYVRVRVFSPVKDKRELHKIEAKKKKLLNHFVPKSRNHTRSLGKGH